MSSVIELDDIDRALLRILRDRPRTPIAEVARLASVARGTATARLARMEDAGVVTGYGPDVDARTIGFGVLAFVTLEIAQGHGPSVVEHLAAIPEVLEVHAVTGPGDLLCRIVARSNEHLDELLQDVLALPGARRSETHLALGTRFHRTACDLAVG